MNIFISFFLFGLWTLTFPIGKYALQFSPPIFLTGFRMIISGLVLIGYLWLRKKIPQRKSWLSIGILALFSIYLTNILEFWSLSKLSATKVCFLYSLSPFLTAFLSYLHFREKMTPLKWVGLCLGVIGFLPGLEGTFGLAELAMLGAVFCSVYGWIILRLLVKEDLPIFFANGASMLLGGLLALATAPFFESTPTSPQTLFPLLLLLTLISNIICYNLYGYLLKRLTATLLSLIGLSSPLFASLHSYILLGDAPSKAILLATPILFLALAIVYREEKRLGYLERAVIR